MPEEMYFEAFISLQKPVIAESNLPSVSEDDAPRSNAASLEDDIQHSREGLLLYPAGHSHHVYALLRLAHSLFTHGNTTGETSTLNEAINFQQEALTFCPPGHPQRTDVMHRLSCSLLLQGLRLHNPDTMKQAVRLCRDALQHYHPGDPAHAEAQLRLSNIQARWAYYAKDIVSLDKAILLAQEVLQTSSIGSSQAADCNSQLGRALFMRSLLKSGDARLKDTDQAIQHERAVLESYPPNHTERPMALLSLSSSLLNQNSSTGQESYLEESISLQEEALELSAPGTFIHGRCLLDLALSNLYLFTYRREADTLVEMNRYIQTVMENPAFPPFTRVEVAKEVLALTTDYALRRYDIGNALHVLADWLSFFKTAIRMLPLIASLDAEPRTRLAALTNSEGLGISATAVALLLGLPEDAIELLEESRALFWAQALRLRTPMDSLPPQEAKQLQALFKSMDGGNGEAQTAAYRRQAGREAEALIASIRQRPQLDRFLLAQTFHMLSLAADRGPVVVLVTHHLLCEAIIVLDQHGSVKRLPLPGLTTIEASVIAETVKVSTNRMRASLSRDLHNLDGSEFQDYTYEVRVAVQS